MLKRRLIQSGLPQKRVCSQGRPGVFAKLPRDVLASIFCLFPINQLSPLMLTCKKFKNVILTTAVLKRIMAANQIFIPEELIKNTGSIILNYHTLQFTNLYNFLNRVTGLITPAYFGLFSRGRTKPVIFEYKAFEIAIKEDLTFELLDEKGVAVAPKREDIIKFYNETILYSPEASQAISSERLGRNKFLQKILKISKSWELDYFIYFPLRKENVPTRFISLAYILKFLIQKKQDSAEITPPP